MKPSQFFLLATFIYASNGMPSAWCAGFGVVCLVLSVICKSTGDGE